MPRKIDPSKIKSGTGTAADRSIDANAIREPAPGKDGLRVHIQDPHNAHGASAIRIQDVGGFYASDTVEGALQELGGVSGTAANIRQNGWTAAGVADFDTAVTTSGLTISIAEDWVATVPGMTGFLQLSAGPIITLPPFSDLYWVYLDVSTETVVASPTPPAFEDGDILIGTFDHEGASITAIQDARFFVRNDNLKVTYTVRSSGSASNANSEGSFASLEASLVWMGVYDGGESEKRTVTLRGHHTTTEVLEIPVSHFTLQGEGDAVLEGPGLFLGSRDHVTVRSLRMESAGATPTALLGASGDHILIEDVEFTGAWETAINLTACSHLTVQRCAATSGGEFGFRLGGEHIKVSHCEVSGFDDSVALSDNSENVVVEDCTLRGFSVSGIFAESNCQGLAILRNTIEEVPDSNEPTATGIHVLSLTGSQNIVCSNNTIKHCWRGIVAQGAEPIRSSTTVTVGTVSPGDILTIKGLALTAVASDPGVDEFEVDADGDITAANIVAAINLSTNSFSNTIVRANATGSVVTLFASQLGPVGDLITVESSDPSMDVANPTLVGGEFNSITGLRICDNHVSLCGKDSGAPSDDFSGAGSLGIGVEWAESPTIQGNEVHEIGIWLDDTDAPTATGGSAFGVYARNCNRVSITSNRIWNIVAGDSAITGCVAVQQRTYGGVEESRLITGEHHIEGNDLWFEPSVYTEASGAQDTQAGILLNVSRGGDAESVTHVMGTGYVTRNTVTRVDAFGIAFFVGDRAAMDGWEVTSNKVRAISGTGIVFSIGDDIAGGSTTDTLSRISALTVADNKIASCQGFGLQMGVERGGSSLNHLLDCRFERNHIGFTAEGGIAVAGNTRTPVLAGLAVHENEIRDAGDGTDGSAILLRSEFAGMHRNWSVSDNTVMDMLSEEPAIVLEQAEQALSQVGINRNKVLTSGGDASPGAGISLSAEINLFQITVEGNHLYTEGDGLHILARTGAMQDVQVGNNQLRVAEGSQHRPLFLESEESLSVGIHSQIQIRGNLFHGGIGNAFFARGGATPGRRIHNVQVHGNQFVGCEEPSDPPPIYGANAALSIRSSFVGLGVGEPVRNLDISDNTFRDCARECVVVYKRAGFGNCVNIRIDNNTVDSSSESSGADVPGIFVIRALNSTNNGGSRVEGVSVSGNTIRNTWVGTDNTAGGNAEINVPRAATIFVRGGPVLNVSVENNRLDSCSVEVDSSAEGSRAAEASQIIVQSTGLARNCHIRNNSIRNCVTEVITQTGNPLVLGVGLLTNVGSISNSITGNSFQQNTLENSNSGALASGGLFALSQLEAGGVLEGGRVEHNTSLADVMVVDNIAGLVSAFRIRAGALIQSTSLSHNQVTATTSNSGGSWSTRSLEWFGESVGGVVSHNSVQVPAHVGLFLHGATHDLMSVANNSIYVANVGDQDAANIAFDATRGASVSGNSFFVNGGAGGSACYLDFGNVSTPSRGFTLNGNSFRGVTDVYALRIRFNGGSSFVFSSNSIDAPSAFSISPEAGTYPESARTIVTSNTSTGGSPWDDLGPTFRAVTTGGEQVQNKG